MRIMSLMALLMLTATGVASAKDETFARTVPAHPRGAVIVSNVAGVVKVTGWDRNEVDIKGELSSRVERVDVRSERGRTTVKVILRGSSRGGSARLELQVPRGSQLDVSAVSADLLSYAVTGAQRLQTVSGDVSAEMDTGDIEVKTVSGNTHLRGQGKPASLRVSTVSGDIRIERGAGRLEATTVSGDLRTELAVFDSVRLRTTSGDVFFKGRLSKGGNFDGETVNGELSVEAPAEAGYEYDVSTFNGDVTNCFNARVERSSSYGPGSRLSGTVGEGAGRIRLRTMNGDVELCDR